MNITQQIHKAARAAGIPERLYESLILHGERSYQGWQTSPAGAYGPAQLMPSTASYLSRKYGIDTSTYYGNLLGGAYYLKEQLSAFGGNPRKAVAAYNAGPGAVSSGRIPSSTQGYVRNVLSGLDGGKGGISMPVGRMDLRGSKDALVQQPDTVSLHLPSPLDITPILSGNLTKIAQGWSPTEVLKESTPSILSDWMQPSQLVRTKAPPLHVPGTQEPTMVANTRGQRRLISGFVTPIDGKIIGLPYQGTHAKAFNVSGGSDNWESENAIDISAKVGTPIRAVADGVIGSQFGPLGSGGRFAGNRLHLVTKGNEYYYAHLSRYAPGIRPGTRVRAGQVIGYSGEANGVGHLHFASKRGNPAGMVKKG